MKEMDAYTDKKPQWPFPDTVYRPGPMLTDFYTLSCFVGQLSVTLRKYLR